MAIAGLMTACNSGSESKETSAPATDTTMKAAPADTTAMAPKADSTAAVK